MFAQHQPTISRWARAHPDNLAHVLQFCVASARQRFYNMPALMDAICNDNASMPAYKHRACAEIWDDREAIHWQCEDMFAHSPEPAVTMLQYLAGLYGLNVAKAGFACQLAYGLSGCLDSVNTARLGLPERFCANLGQRRTARARQALARRYNAMIIKCGDTERLWDEWCSAMSERYPKQFPTPHTASALHLTCLGVT